MQHRFLCMAMLTLVFVANGEGQSLRAFGMKLGMSEASQQWVYTPAELSGLSVFDQPRRGWNAVLFAEWFTHPSLSVLTELNFIQKGAEDAFIIVSAESPDEIGKKIIDPRIDYLSFPILVKFRHAMGGTDLYCFAGPRMDLIVGRNSYGEGLVFSDFRSPEFGLSYGIGVDHSIFSNMRFGGELRHSFSPQRAYDNGLVSVRNSSYELLMSLTQVF